MPRRKIRRRLRKRQGPQKQGLIDAIYRNTKTASKVYGAAAVARKTIIQAARKGRGAQMKKKDPGEWQVNEADGIKFKNYTISYKKTQIAKLTQKLSQVGTVYDYTSSGVASGQGNQQAGVVSSTVSANIQDLYTTINGTIVITPAQESRKMFFGTSMHEMQFNNAGNTTLDFDIYILIDKNTQPLASAPGTVWDNAIAAEAFNAVAPGEAKTDLWTFPTAHKLWNITYWTKRLKCSLTPGENCRLKFRFNINRLLDTQYIEEFQSIRGITHHVMIVTRGSLGDGTQTLAVTAGQQTITPSKLIWVLKRTWTGSIVTSLPRVNRQLANELPSAVAALYQQDEDSGLVENSMLPANYA